MTSGTVLDDATAEHWQMVTDNTGLVWRHVNRMKLPETQRDDAYQDGLFGLLRAAMLYDEARGFTFSTYADAWIRQAIERGRGRLEGRNYRRAADPRYGGSYRSYEPPTSLDAEVLGGGGDALRDFLEGDDPDPAELGTLAAVADEASARMLRCCRDSLDLDIVASMVGDDGQGALRVIAERHGVTREIVRRRRIRLRELARPHFEEAA